MPSPALKKSLETLRGLPMPTEKETTAFLDAGALMGDDTSAKGELFRMLVEINHPWHNYGQVKVAAMSEEAAAELMRLWKDIRATAQGQLLALPVSDPRRKLAHLDDLDAPSANHPFAVVNIMELSKKDAARKLALLTREPQPPK